MSKNIIKIFIITILASTAMSAEKKGRAPAKEMKAPEGISYSVLNYREEKVLRANQVGIAYKKEWAEKKLPVVIFIHGGGWRKGDKDQMAYFAVNYAKAGFVGVTVSYRLLSEAKYPAQAQDAKEAIRFIKSLADKYPIDVNRIGVAGYSAGAHLALLIALSGDEPLYQSDKYTNYDSSVKCAVGISSPIDFSQKKKISFLNNEQNQNKQVMKKSSPINYVQKGQIPIMLFHGDKDALVPSYHYKNFLAKAKEMGINNIETHINPQGDHVFFFKNSRIVNPLMMKFFKKHLKK